MLPPHKCSDCACWHCLDTASGTGLCCLGPARTVTTKSYGCWSFQWKKFAGTVIDLTRCGEADDAESA